MLDWTFPPEESKQKRIKVAIDFDGTITADLPVWIPLIRMMQLAGWEPAIVTWRPSSAHEEVDEFQAELAIPIPVVYCNGCAKRECYDADIWIDDNPASVLFSLTRPPTLAWDRGSREELVLSSNPSISIDHQLLKPVKTE